MKNSRISYTKYITLIVVGVMLTVALAFNIMELPRWVEILLDIISLLGSGVACSGLVALLMEYSKMQWRQRELEEQRTYICNTLRGRIGHLIYVEIQNITSFIAAAHDQPAKLTKSAGSESDILQMINKYLEHISIDDINPKSEVETEVTKKLAQRKSEYLTRAVNNYYNTHQTLTSLLDNDNYYLTGIISKDMLNVLEQMKSNVQSIIHASSMERISNLIDMKKEFFSTLNDSMQILNFDLDKEIKYYIVENIDNIIAPQTADNQTQQMQMNV